jgi:hypothetical protein
VRVQVTAKILYANERVAAREPACCCYLGREHLGREHLGREHGLDLVLAGVRREPAQGVAQRLAATAARAPRFLLLSGDERSLLTI